jgi:hypothetical protein
MARASGETREPLFCVINSPVRFNSRLLLFGKIGSGVDRFDFVEVLNVVVSSGGANVTVHLFKCAGIYGLGSVNLLEHPRYSFR